MSHVTVIGLGNMGSALARAFVENGCTVTIWNRSPEKAGPLLERGAVLASDAASAIAASPMTVMCVTNDAAAKQIMTDNEGALSGRLLVQLTSSAPQEARAGQTWAQQHHVQYLQGAITGSTASIGTPEAHILLAGSEAAFLKAEPVMRALATDLDYKGEDVGLAPAWDMVMLMHYYGMFLSLFHSVQICQAEGIPLEQFITLLGEQGDEYEQWLVGNIQSGDYQETSAPLELWAGGIGFIARHARESGIDAGFTTFASDIFQKAMAAGFGRQEVSAVYKVLERDSGRSQQADMT